MNKKWIIIIGVSILVISCVIGGASFAEFNDNDVFNGSIQIGNQVEADFPNMVGIAQNQAVESALADVQGQVLSVKLENEDSFLVYGIEIVTADRSIMEVKVDAGSGKVLAMERDKVDDKGNESGEHDNDRGHKD